MNPTVAKVLGFLFGIIMGFLVSVLIVILLFYIRMQLVIHS
jgi:hypothetical protein